MKYALRILVTLSLLWGSFPLFPQANNVVSDGTVGIYKIGWKHDTAYVKFITRNSPAWNAGIRWLDGLLEINDSLLSGKHHRSRDVLNMLSLRAGDSLKLTFKSEKSQTVETCWLRTDPRLSVWQSLEFEYLADTTGAWTLEEVMTDSIGALFSDVVSKKILVHSVKKGSKAEDLGIKAGDRYISLADDLDGDFFVFLENNTSSYVHYDTSLYILREDTIRIPQADPSRKKLTAGASSQFKVDWESKRIWLRITITPRLHDSEELIFRSQSFADTTFFFKPSAEGPYIREMAGMRVEEEQRDLEYKGMSLFNLELKDGEPVTVYLLYTGDDAVWPKEMNIIGKEEFLSYGTNERIFIGILAGMLLLVALYYLALFIAHRKRSYLWYSLFILGYFHYLLFDWGYLSEMWRAYYLFIWNLYELVQALPMIFFILFAISYLEINKRLKTWYRILLADLGILTLSTGIFILYFLITGFTERSHLMNVVEWIYYISLLLIPFGLLLIIPVILIRKKFTPAWYFLIASLVMLGLLIYWINTPVELRADTLYDSTWTMIMKNYGVYMGLVVQFIIFSAGLGRKMRGTELARKKAQERLIKQLQENEKLKDKVNRELEQKVQERTKEIMEQKEEIEAQRDEIQIQKDVVMVQKEEIMDSINYAQRIQAAVLPHSEFLEKVLPEHFILYRPRDVVSGDFYWVKEVKNFLVVVAADCTGHGVPGAFMSMLGISLLNEIVGKSRFDEPGEILDRLRKKVKLTLTQKGEIYEQKDGMDMALAVIDRESLEVHFSGAFNPLYVIREKDGKSGESTKTDDLVALDNDTHQLFELKANRQPIGIHEIETEFNTTIFQLVKGDNLYMFSDGFSDQIGGPKAKKFLSKNFKRVLLDLQFFDMIEQERYLNRTLDEWSEGYEQVDDILIIGLRI